MALPSFAHSLRHPVRFGRGSIRLLADAIARTPARLAIGCGPAATGTWALVGKYGGREKLMFDGPIREVRSGKGI